MSTVESVTLLLKWFSQENHPDFHDANEVLASAITSAITLYREGHTELFDSILSLYLESAKVWNTVASNAMVKFFVETNTQYCAALSAATLCEDEPYRISNLLHADSTIIEYLKNAYLNGSLKSHRAFHEIVLWYVRDKLKYVEYADLIKAIDGIDLPEYKAPIDHDALKRKGAQEYFEALFDEEKRNVLTTQLLYAIGNPDVTTKQLLDINIKADHHYRHSALRRLQSALYRYGTDVKVSEFFNRIDIDRFILWSASHFLSEESTVVPTHTEKEKLTEIVANILKERNFANSVTYYPDGFSLKPLTKALLSIIRYLDYPLDEKALLDLTELPAYIFDKNNERTKYVYLQQKLSLDKLKLRLVQNVATQRVRDTVLKDHIDFFDSCKDSSLAEYALKICNDPNDTYLRSIAWRYLYNTLGAEYVASEIQPIADMELLLEIAGTCKDISREKLCKAMEREYLKQPSIQLQAHLITYGSSIALNDYVTKVMHDKQLPEGKGIYIHGPTEAIRSIHDPTFLPQLELLLQTVFDPDFKDNTWRGLQDSLSKALINCGTTACDETIEMIKKYRPSAEVNEGNYRYCNYTIEEIARARKSTLDMPKSLFETKTLLRKVKEYTN